MRISWRGWHAVYAGVLCVCVHSTFTKADNLVGDMETLETRQPFRETYDEKPSRGSGFLKKLIPIKEPLVDRNFDMRATRLDPDAEMLPAHYTGIKPPGVDHMELRYAESQITKVLPKIVASRKNKGDSNERELSETLDSKGVGDEEGYEKAASIEEERQGDSVVKKGKRQDVEAGGRKRAHDISEKNSAYKMKQVNGNDGANYQGKDKEHVDRKAAGYHNVYHKDEQKKKHDFYDNGDHGGHVKKHGRYNEKHVATEGKFKKGGTHNSGLEEAELRKKGVAGNTQTDGESKGREASHGYDAFFKNFQGFAKQIDGNKGQWSGFGQTKSR